MRLAAVVVAVFAWFSISCGGGNPDDPPGPGSTPDAPGPADADATTSVDGGAAPQLVGTCADPPPSGAVLPPPLPAYSGGTCPAITAGRNTITSGGVERELVVVAPGDLGPDERLPVLFVWHHLGGDADGIIEHGDLQASADALRVLVIVPEKKGDVTLPLVGTDLVWPYLDIFGDARVEEEARFFDDMLSCVAEVFPIDASCISSAGVSAGGLWTTLLAQRRSERLASAIVLSGGVGPALGYGVAEVRPWTGAARPLPMLVLWGGPTDRCVVDFDRASTNLETALTDDGHFLVECVHNCGHAVPPVDPAVGMSALWRFALDHPYWLSPGASPYLNGMPSTAPSWCAVGMGGATPRVGMCTETSVDSGCPSIP